LLFRAKHIRPLHRAVVVVDTDDPLAVIRR
jgi:hypothetical protein